MAEQSRFHKSRQRRAERAPLTASGSLNLVPLVDILTSIVFFSLATFTGAALAALTAFDLSLPPTVVTGQEARNVAPEQTLNLLLAVRIQGNKLRVEHGGGATPFVKEITGLGEQQMAELRATLEGVRRSYPDNKDVLVVPDDAVSYDDVIKVLEQARLAQFTNLSLGSRARASRVAAASPASNSGGR